jgi:major membrane immunogen (membrane-anchored lipoprotein)
MKAIALVFILLTLVLLSGCDSNDNTAAYCKQSGYKGIVSETNSHSCSYCSNGEIVHDKFLTNNGEVDSTYAVKGITYKREYVEFK